MQQAYDASEPHLILLRGWLDHARRNDALLQKSQPPIQGSLCTSPFIVAA